jgi:hypothetical protein
MTLQVNSAPGQYVRPKVSVRGPLCIVEGRHPLIEQLQSSDDFVPNDTYLAGVSLHGASVHAFAPHACPDAHTWQGAGAVAGRGSLQSRDLGCAALNRQAVESAL